MTLSARTIRVLNVNDDDGARAYKTTLFSAAGFAVTEAARVDEARRRIAEHDPDVILLDVNLPDGNGVDLCRELQPAETTPDTFEGDRPYAIALISAYVTQPDDIARGMAAGADAYLVEPLDDTYLVGLLRSLADRHARRRAVARERAALRARDIRYRILSATVGDAVYEWDLTTDDIEWSDGLHRMLHYPAISVGRTSQWRVDLTHAEDRPRLAQEIHRVLTERETSWEIESRIARADGSHAIVVDRATIVYAGDGTPLRAIGVMSDVTERRQLMDQLRLAQKMEAVGQLAGGIAHDFNNVLTSVMGFTGLIKHEVTDRPSVFDHASEIEAAAHRASEMVAQLMAFSRDQEMRPEILDLNELIEGSAAMLDRLIGAHIRIDRELDRTLPTVRADRTQMEQVLLNLSVNARDAMADGGRLLVTTGVVDIPRNTRERRTMQRGRYVKLAVADTGVGMDEHTRARIFEPFFTTKEPGRGTGLGLATVYGIVKQSGGYIWVTSAPGAGTTFDVFLPALDLPAAPAALRECVETHVARAGETVLVVEDEASVRRLACEVLSRAGYEVLEAADGVQALTIAQRHSAGIHLLLTDLVLPGLSGVGLAQAFRECHAGAGVLFMTGYVREADGVDALTVDCKTLLTKPFSRDELLQAVREGIDARSADLPPFEPT